VERVELNRKMISEIILVMLVVGFLALAVQTESVKAESATLTGTVLYNEKPVSQFTSKAAVLWVRNESSGESFPTNPTYDPSTGEYTIPDVPPGEYGISVFIDDALPFNGLSGFAGDFDGWASPIVVAEGQPIVNRNLTVVKTLHLTSPVDNAAVIGPWSYPEDTYPTEEIMFMWDVLAEASSYHSSIEEYEESFTYVWLVADHVTSDVEWNVALPMSVENHFYLFQLYAYNINDLMVGKLMVPYSAGYGWDYRFRLAPEAVVGSCSSAGDQKDHFDLGETVYVIGANFSASETYNFSIVVDQETWTDGMAIPERVSGTVITVSSNSDGDIPPTAVWTGPQTVGKYDVVVDVNGNGQYDVGIDALDDGDMEVTAGFSVIPEFPPALILSIFMMATLLAIAVPRSRSRKGSHTSALAPTSTCYLSSDKFRRG
jgi:hypothetical protein